MPLPPDEPIDEEKLEQLPEDTNQTPFSPSDDTASYSDQAQAGMSSLQPTDDDQTELAEGEDRKVVRPDVGGIDSTHPATDTNFLQEEAYDEGISGAAEAGEPNADSAVRGYDKPGGEQE